MAITSVPNVLVCVREKGGKRTFYPAPSVPDLTANYWLRYERAGKQAWQRVGHYDLVAKAKLLLERRLSAVAQGFILPEDQVLAKPSPARVTIQATVNAYLASLRTKKRPAKSISDKNVTSATSRRFAKNSLSMRSLPPTFWTSASISAPRNTPSARSTTTL